MGKYKKSYDLIAPFYDFTAYFFFGNALSRSQNYMLPIIGKYKNTLIVGGGTGKILADLIKHNVSEHYFYSDTSEGMILEAKKLILKRYPEHFSRIVFSSEAIHTIPDRYHFDLIITPYVLDLFHMDKLAAMTQQLNKKLLPGGAWLFIDFNISEYSFFMRFISKCIIKLLYLTFRVLSLAETAVLPRFNDIFSSLNYRLKQEKFFLKGLLTAKLYIKPR